MRWPVLLLLAACSPTGLRPDVVVCAEDLPEMSQQKLPMQAPMADAVSQLFPTTLVLDVDHRVLPFVQQSAAKYMDKLGLRIEVAHGGITFAVEDEIPYRGGYVDGLAHYDTLCVFDECQPALTSIVIAAALLDEKQWALQETVDHEIGHIVSGWGSAIGWPQHFKEPGHLMSPGCVNHVCAPWTEEDAEMMCAGAPCTKIEL